MHKLFGKCSLFQAFLYFCTDIEIISVVKGLKGLFWFLYKFFAFYCLLVYALVFWVPSAHWIAGFMMMSFPVTILCNLVFFVFWLLVDSGKSLAPVVMLALAGIFLERTYQFGTSSPESAKTGQKSLTVLNYNVFGFWIRPEHKKENAAETEEMKAWIVSQGAGVICMPEFNNDGRNPTYQTMEFFRKGGYPYHVVYENDKMKEKSYFQSLAIFSKYPIIRHRQHRFEAQNGLVSADIAVGKDTVRIIAVHLYSMSLRLSKLVNEKQMSGLKKETRGTLSSMKKGFSSRADETHLLEEWIEKSPYPVVVCGDFNETPYSYPYGRIRKLLTNAFEEKGSGFGFTYNKLPYFIRIDNQFYNNKALDLVRFETLRKVKFSDHYPCIGTYQLK